MAVITSFFLTFIIPYLFWVWFNLGFINGPYFVGNDGGDYFNWVIYHFEHILEGVYPQWNPFHNLGILDYLQIPIPGGFNPFLLIIPFLMKCHVPPGAAYIMFIFLYAGIFFLGFYCLVRLLCRDMYIAFLGNVILMFSSIFAVHIFYQTDLLILLTPMIWFYVFLIIFLKSGTDEELCYSVLGMVLTLMLVLNSYLPFPFITIALCVFIAGLIVSPSWIKDFVNACRRLFTQKPWIALLAVIGLIAGFYPGLKCYLNIKDPQNMYISARSNLKTGNDAGVSNQAIQEGALFTKTSYEEFFSDFSTGAQSYSYVSNIIFLFFFLFAFNRLGRKQVAIAIAGLLLFFLTIGNVSGFQTFLYNHVFMFRLFRNYFYFWSDLLVMTLLFLMLELKAFLEMEFINLPKKVLGASWVCLVHLGFILFLHSLENVPVSSFILTACSGIWFLLWVLYSPFHRHRGLFVAGLALIALIQPLDVLHYFRSFDNTTMVPREHPYYAMNFMYERPAIDPDPRYDNCYEYPKFRIDDSGFCTKRYYGQRYFYSLKENVNLDVLKKYVRYKFILYTSVSGMDYSKPDWGKIEAALSGARGEAVIDSLDPGIVNAGRPRFILNASDQLCVTRFEANRLSINVDLPEKMFLVYNDNFHDQWRVFIDGAPKKLYRANYAFKGVWVGPGKHKVEFIFGNSWEKIFYFDLIFITFGLLVIIVFSFIRIALKRV